MSPRSTEMLRGTLDLLVLRTLLAQPLHGIAVADRIKALTAGTFAVGPGSLFPALHRLEQGGWVRGAWRASERGRRVREYTLTAAGRRRLAAERKQWARIVEAVGQVLDAES